MPTVPSRRTFLKSAAAAPLAAAYLAPARVSAAVAEQAAAAASGTPKKSMLVSLLQPKDLPPVEE